MKPTLDELGLKYGTDKSSNGHNYLKYYDMFFSPIRGKDILLLEIGTWEGASLKMWDEYFYNRKLIVGADIDEKEQYRTPSIWTIECDQSKVDHLDNVGIIHGPFDIILDDGSHDADHQILTFETMFPYVKPNGFYVIEDTLCSYDKSRWVKNADVYDRIRQMVGEINLNGKISNYEINADKRKQVAKYDNVLNNFERQIEWMAVFCGTTVIKKM